MEKFVILKLKRKVKGDTCQLIPPLYAKVRQWGNGTEDMPTIVSLPESELLAYFAAIEDLKERLGYKIKVVHELGDIDAKETGG